MGLGLSILVREIASFRRQPKDQIYRQPIEKWRTGNSIFDIYARTVYRMVSSLKTNNKEITYEFPEHGAYFTLSDKNLYHRFDDFYGHLHHLTPIDILDTWKSIYEKGVYKSFETKDPHTCLNILCITELCREWMEEYTTEGYRRVIKRMELKHLKYLKKRCDVFPKELYPIIISY